jgi:acyl-CoA dehydrogenase
MEELKARARALGLWNMFLAKPYKEGIRLSNLEYAIIAEISGRSTLIAPEVTK